MKSDTRNYANLIIGMRAAYARGDNVMAWARENNKRKDNSVACTLIAYDLQAGSYVDYARANPDYIDAWCTQLAGFINPYVEPGDHILEVGVGEATTLAGVINKINCSNVYASGFDVSWSRIKTARSWIVEKEVSACLFVGDLFHIPLADNSIDIVYTSHSLEPNGGKETAAIAELLRVVRKAVVMVEPIYEMGSEKAKQRMSEHGYVRGLKDTATKLGAKVIEYGLLETCNNPLNPSGVLILTKHEQAKHKVSIKSTLSWQCPLTNSPLLVQEDLFYADKVGIAYPVLRGIPLLRIEHGVAASKILG